MRESKTTSSQRNTRKSCIAGIDFASLAQSFFKLLGTAMGAAVSFIATIVSDIWKDITGYFQKYLTNDDGTKKTGIDWVKGICKGIVEGVKSIGTWIYDNVFKPFIDGFKSAFGIHSPSTVKSCPIKVKIDGSQLNLSWTKNKTDKTSTGVMMVTKATSSTFTVSKPFFTLSFYDGKQTYEDTFSMYDIENAPTTVSADEITIDGSASSIAEFSNYLGTKSVDGSLKVTWSLGNHSYSKTVKNVYSTSYVIPVSWLDAISDSSQAYGGGKVTVQISYGTKVYTTISATFNCIVSDTFLPTISSVTLADKTNTPVPASWNKVFVQNQSGIRVSAITCAASQGATVKRIKLRLDTQYTEQTYSASSLPQINRIINSGSLECEVTITDSRGRTCSKTATVNVLPYDIPKFTLIESDRCNKTGEMDNDGTYFLSQSAVEYSSCTGLNSITITAEYKKTDTSEWLNKKTIKPGSNVLGGELDTEFSYDVRYILKDAFSTVTYIDYVSTAIYLMHFLHGGRGVAFGQKATMDNTLDCAFKALFREDVTIVKQDGTQVSMREVLEKLGF